MTAFAVIVGVFLAWLALAWLVSVVVGRVVARRDTEVPTARQDDETPF